MENYNTSQKRFFVDHHTLHEEGRNFVESMPWNNFVFSYSS